MKLVENVEEFLDKKSKLLSMEFYGYILSQLNNDDHWLCGPPESPVEQLFWIEYQFRLFNNSITKYFRIHPQHHSEHETGRYRLDFDVDFIVSAYKKFPKKGWSYAVEFVDMPKIGIEIDSHIWHEKTKEQAQKDKERERFLISNGWKLIRFTGKEVYDNPSKCLDATLDITEPIRENYFRSIKKKAKEKNIE